MDRSLAESLKKTAICTALSDAELDAVAAIAERVTYLAGEELFAEGDAGDGLYLVIAGEIDVLKRTPTGERSLARLGPGGVLGEMSLLTEDARSATGRSLGETSVLRLPAAPFRALLGEGSSAALKVVAGIAEVLAARVAGMNAKMLELAEQAEKVQPDSVKAENLVHLHRMLQVWSF